MEKMEHQQSKDDLLSLDPNPNSNPNSNSNSNSNPCPICLGPVTDDSYLDQCFHKFCYNCILRWTKVAACKYSVVPTSVKCPLCKTENSSIVHGCDGISFQQHYIGQDIQISDFFTKAHKYRLQCYYSETDKQEEDVDIIVHHILGVIDSWRSNEQTSSRTSPEAKRERFEVLVSEAARRFLAGRTKQFVNELEMFLASGLNIDAYDKVYLKNMGWKIPEITEDEEEPLEHTSVVPNLYFIDEDSDYTD